MTSSEGTSNRRLLLPPPSAESFAPKSSRWLLLSSGRRSLNIERFESWFVDKFMAPTKLRDGGTVNAEPWRAFGSSPFVGTIGGEVFDLLSLLLSKTCPDTRRSIKNGGYGGYHDPVCGNITLGDFSVDAANGFLVLCSVPGFFSSGYNSLSSLFRILANFISISLLHKGLFSVPSACNSENLFVQTRFRFLRGLKGNGRELVYGADDDCWWDGSAPGSFRDCTMYVYIK